MNGTENERQKTTIIKTLAIIGFIVALVFVAWLAVQAVRLAPAAFDTLGSIAASFRNEQTQFTLSTDTTLLNTGEILTVSWTRAGADGTYAFSYQCTDGVVAEIRDESGNLSKVECDTNVPLGKNTESAAVVFSSERSRYADVPYTIEFTPDGEEPQAQTAKVTVVNPAVSEDGLATTDNGTVAEEDNNDSAPPEPRPEPTPEPEETSDPEPPSADIPPVQYRTVPVVVTKMPESDPSGFTDLAATFIGVGTYDTSTKIFTPHSSLEEDERGALRFEVKNIGTKTSDVWYFSATLPTDADFTYKSSANAPLKPNERQIITLQFDDVSKDGSERISATVTGGGDINAANNSFSKTVDIED
ncbi:hypothetical protein HY416_00145 [Candidatus Kaiserbacteria bacterium]|nr:hypothetical protein [Candidatus Kaiserbacteria bacterium]